MRTLLIAISALLTQGAIPVPTGSISGRILSLNGAPATNARVQALQLSEDASTPANAIFVFALTDANGEYRLENMPPGRYYVAVGSIESPTYFPGVPAIKAATAVSIRAEERLSGFDFKMVIPPPLRISGRVNGGGRNILQLNGPRSQFLLAGPDPSFQFTNLVPGDYEIALVSSQFAQPTLLPIRITLVDRDVTNVELGTPPATVSANVEVERSGPQPRFRLSFVSNNSENGNLVPANTASFLVVPGLNVSLLPGKYRVSVAGLPDGYSVKSIQANQTEIGGGATFEVASKDSIALKISLAVADPSPWVSVRGRVTGPEKANIRTVVLNGDALAVSASAAVGTDGSFEVPMILAGTYTISPSPLNGYFPRPLVVAHNDVSGVEISPPHE